MISMSNVELQLTTYVSGYDETIEKIKVLLSTPAGTVPFDREYGIDTTILDKPLTIAKALLRVEYIEKIKKYFENINVDRIMFENDVIEGFLIPKVVISIGN